MTVESAATARAQPSRFDLPEPHLIEVKVEAADIDAYDHVNNAVYVTWCDRSAWDHSAALGLPISRCLELDRGMAVVRTVITYLRPALLDDVVLVATWLLPSESKLRVRRRFQLVRPSDSITLARAEVEYVCIELSTGRPTRWPREFREGYVPLPVVAAAVGGLEPL
jgi:acyl-CoA thioester hydrolase